MNQRADRETYIPLPHLTPAGWWSDRSTRQRHLARPRECEPNNPFHASARSCRFLACSRTCPPPATASARFARFCAASASPSASSGTLPASSARFSAPSATRSAPSATSSDPPAKPSAPTASPSTASATLSASSAEMVAELLNALVRFLERNHWLAI